MLTFYQQNDETKTNALLELVIAYTPYSYSRNSVTIKQFIKERLPRNLAILTINIETLINDPKILKKPLIESLINKYGLRDLSSHPNAYLCEPEISEDDKDLHEYFLHPYYLLSLNNERKFLGIDPETENKEWLWSITGSDSSPLLRKIIQLYLLDHLSADEFINELPEGFDPKEKLEELKEQIKTEALKLFNSTYNENINTENNDNSFIDRIFGGLKQRITAHIRKNHNGVVKLQHFFAFGRLAYGEPEENSAYKQMLQKNILEEFYLSLSIFSEKFKLFLNYLRNEVNKIKDSSQNSIFNIQTLKKILKNIKVLHNIGDNLAYNSLTYISAALLSLSKLTSLPFSLIRKYIANTHLLKFLDLLELGKDIFFIRKITLAAIWFIFSKHNQFIRMFHSLPPQLALISIALSLIQAIISRVNYGELYIIMSINALLYSYLNIYLLRNLAYKTLGLISTLAYVCIEISGKILFPNRHEKIKLILIKFDEELAALQDRAQFLAGTKIVKYRELLRSAIGKTNSKKDNIIHMFLELFKTNDVVRTDINEEIITASQAKFTSLYDRLTSEEIHSTEDALVKAKIDLKAAIQEAEALSSIDNTKYQHYTRVLNTA